MTAGTRLWPNLGAEEGPDWPRWLREPRVARIAELWRLGFGQAARFEPVPLAPALSESWPPALGPETDVPAFAWLAETGSRVAWLVDEDAPSDTASPPPAVVRRVHDKSFALEQARALALEPEPLRGLAIVLEPELLRDCERAVAALAATLARWPPWARQRFTLKPRRGTSGRGRVAGRDANVRSAAVRAALPRLADRGGAVLEPWLERERDFSVQLALPAAGPIQLVSSLEATLTESGLFRGHRGEVDSRGRVFSGDLRDESLRGAAVELAAAARAAGLRGPAGVDAFSFRHDGSSWLRPVVELNARFTTGHVTAALVRRARPRLVTEMGLSPGERLAFVFALEETGGRPWEAVSGGHRDVLCLPLAPAGVAVRPALLFARETEVLATLTGV